MAKKQKIDNDLLVDAVIKYADICKGKIKYKELAEWSAANIPGLEAVKDYMFSRPIIVRDALTGIKKEQERPCTIRIKEINASRNVSVGMSTNILLRASNIDEFMSLPKQEQRKAIQATREQVDTLYRSNIYLNREIKRVDVENNRLKELFSELEQKLMVITDLHETLKKQINCIRKYVDESLRIQALERIGITEDGFQLVVNQESMMMQDIFSFEKAIKNFQKSIDQIDEPNSEESTSLSDDIMKGLDF